MDHYYVNHTAQASGEREVHKNGCRHMPEEGNRRYVGFFANCRAALYEAQKHYPDVDGCRFCSPECHRR